jgi:hypothetical protein
VTLSVHVTPLPTGGTAWRTSTGDWGGSERQPFGKNPAAWLQYLRRRVRVPGHRIRWAGAALTRTPTGYHLTTTTEKRP